MLKVARATFLQRFIIVNGESLEKKKLNHDSREKKSPNHASRKRNG